MNTVLEKLPLVGSGKSGMSKIIAEIVVDAGQAQKRACNPVLARRVWRSRIYTLKQGYRKVIRLCPLASILTLI